MKKADRAEKARTGRPTDHGRGSVKNLKQESIPITIISCHKTDVTDGGILDIAKLDDEVSKGHCQYIYLANRTDPNIFENAMLRKGLQPKSRIITKPNRRTLEGK